MNQNKLEEILENKRREIKEFKELHGEHIYSGGGHDVPSFKNALSNEENLSVIAEIKRMSPSQGIMNMEESPVEIAKIYEEVGADAVSVLTDSKFFGGSFEFLKEISKNIKNPILCKDFIIDRIQIDLAKLSGASAVLLITDILDDRQLLDLYEYTYKQGIEALVEAHLPENIKRAVELQAEIIGINNRNLFKFEEDLKHSMKNVYLIPEETVKLSLSSIRTRDDALNIARYGFDGILIGAVLMKAFNKKAALNSFLGIPKSMRELSEINGGKDSVETGIWL